MHLTVRKNQAPGKERENNMYETYATPEYYRGSYGGDIIPEESLQKALRKSSQHIDSLTYNRIVGRGIINLTRFQQDIVREVVCHQAEFEYENADDLDTILSGYSINGVSTQFGKGINMHVQKGVVMTKDVYELLSQTGLCCGLAVR